MNWPVIKLRDLQQKKRGSLDPSKNSNEIFTLYSIPAYDMGKPQILRGNEIGSSKQLVSNGDVLISKIVPHIRRAWVVDDSYGHRQIASGEWIVFNSEKILPVFFRQFLLSDVFHRKFMTTVAGVGGSLLRAQPRLVADFNFSLPPLAEQQRIAELLDTADRILKLRESAIAKLDELAQSWFNELISQPNIDHINLKQLCEISSGFAFKSELYSDDGNAHIIRISDIQNNVVTIKESARMALSNVGKGLTCKLNSNDILMAMSGATTGKFGILEDIKTTQVFLNQRVGRFVIKDEKKLSRQFLIALINSDFYKSHVLNTAAGAAQPNISSKQLVDIEIKLPSLIQQSEFSKRIEIINHIKQRSMAFIERESALITSLQHQSFAVN